MKKILIYGAGAIGVYLGTKLSKNNEVSLYGGKKLKNVGDEVKINGELYKLPAKINSIEPNSSYDVIFVTTKLYDAKKVIEEIEKEKIAYDKVVFIQNGLVEKEFYDELRDIGDVVTLSIFEGYSLNKNELIANKNINGWQVDPTESGKEIMELLNEAEIKSDINPEISQIRAEKMLMVSAAAGLSVINDKTLGELLDDDECRQKLFEILEEGFNILKDDFHLGDFSVFKEKFTRTLEGMRDHYPSLYQDVKLEKQTEIEFLNGLIVKMGMYKNIPTPFNQEIYFQIKRITEHKNSEVNEEIKKQYKLI